METLGQKVVFVPLDYRLHWDWIFRRARPTLASDTRGIIALRDGRIVAGAIMDNWSHNGCMVHLAIDDPFVIRHGFLHEISRYVFIEAGMGVMLGLTPANNAEALRFNKHVGMREVYRIPDGYLPGVDYVLQMMTRDECRWLGKMIKRAA